MSQRIVIECDEAHESPVEGRTVEIHALGLSIAVDLCEAHEAQLRAVVERLAELGRPIELTMVGDDWPCPDCGRLFASKQGVATHRTRTHGHGR